MSRKRFSILLLAAVLILTSAAPVLASNVAALRRVRISGAGFRPNPVVARVGDTVGWLNRDDIAHTSTSDTGLWDSGVINPGGRFGVVFDAPGEYTYHCEIHPGLSGLVIVVE